MQFVCNLVRADGVKMPRMLKRAASAAVPKPVQYVFQANLGRRRAHFTHHPETSSVLSSPSSTDPSVIELANAELSACALLTVGVRARERETGADNVASTFTVSCVRVEVRLQE